MKLTVLGARGSMPVSGKDYLAYGGATSCYLIETEHEAIFLDAGSGIVKSPDVGTRRVSVFLSHPHLDHILGLPFCPMLSQKDRELSLYALKFDGIGAKDHVNQVFSVPIWPLHLANYPSNLTFVDLEESGEKDFGEVKISWTLGHHPGKCLVFKITDSKTSIVYATDYEHTEASDERLVSFAKDADVFIYDGQYEEDEYKTKKGFGHSTAPHGLKLFEESHAKKLLITHHDPFAKDDDLKLREESLRAKNSNVSFAKEGDVFTF